MIFVVRAGVVSYEKAYTFKRENLMEIILIVKFQTIKDDFDPLRKKIAFFAGKAVLFSSTRKTLFFC